MARPQDRTEETPQNATPLDEGTLLGDRFRVTGVLGIGGFGVTYLAIDEVLEMTVAVKEYMPKTLALRQADSDDVRPVSGGTVEAFEARRQRFLEEARRLATFEHHPHIVRVRTFFKENGTSYLVMNYYEGQTLAEYLDANNGFLPEAEGLRMMEQVLNGLRAVHDQEVLHRDIDPENLYLTDSGKVVLLDFGTARTMVAKRTKSLSVILKRGYAPIEQYQNQTPQGPWTDVYAAAATLYRTLTGYKPPEASARVLEDELVAPQTLMPSLTEDTEAALLAGLTLDPEARPSSVAALADRLPPPETAAADTQRSYGRTEPQRPERTGTTTVRVSASHACQLYADDEPVATLPASDEQVLALDDPPHHLRAVRLPSSEATEALRSADGGTGPPTESATTALGVWEETVGGDGTPAGDVEIDFADEAPPAVSTPSGPHSGSALRVRADTPCRLLVDGTDVGRAGPDAPAAVTVDPGDYRIRAESTEGSTAWEQTVTVEQGRDTELDVALTGTDIDPAKPPPRPGWPLLVAGLAVVALIASGFVWVWLGNQAPNPAPDRLMVADAGVLRPLSNDHDPEREGLSLRSVAPLPDSVGTVTLIDSSRIRVELADGYAGTVRTHYTVADAGGRTARAPVVVEAPFWSRPRPITRTLSAPQTVRTTALDGGAAADVIVASTGPSEGTVSVVENRQTVAEPFGAATPVDTGLGTGLSVATGQITDGEEADIVVGASSPSRLVWYENQVEGYGEAQVIDEGVGDVRAVQVEDLDGDGDADLVAGLRSADQVVWYENEGGTFGDPRPVASRISGVKAVHLARLSADARPDVVVATDRGRVLWYENHPGEGGRFQIRHQLGTGIVDPVEVHAADLTNDGERDVLVSSAGGEAILWFENRTQDVGSPAFEPKRTLARGTEHVKALVTADLNGNGRTDVLGRSAAEGTLLYCANQGDGHFGRVQTITTSLQDVASIRIADVDQDGGPDVIAASPAENRVAWYPNYLSP